MPHRRSDEIAVDHRAELGDAILLIEELVTIAMVTLVWVYTFRNPYRHTHRLFFGKIQISFQICFLNVLLNELLD